jgi:hypothetical protein
MRLFWRPSAPDAVLEKKDDSEHAIRCCSCFLWGYV